MSTADEEQRRHDLRHALMRRLDTLIEGSKDPHEWHQAGVLMFQLALSAHLRFGRPSSVHVTLDDYGPFRGFILDTLECVQWLYENALIHVPNDNPVGRCSIQSDQQLAMIFAHYAKGHYAKDERFIEFQAILGKLALIDTPAAQHQLAIASGLMARASWWMHMSDPGHSTMENQAQRCDLLARRHFSANPVPADQMQAYRSHLLAMALIHDELRIAGWRRTYAWPAFWLSLHYCDTKYAMRALMIVARGMKGEKWLRDRRDTPEVYTEASAKMNELWPSRDA